MNRARIHIRWLCFTRSRVLLLLILFFTSFSLQAQWVKEDDTSRVWMKDGIYLNAEEFYTNSPSAEWVLISDKEWRYRDSIQRKGVLVEITSREIVRSNIDIRSHRVLCDTGTGRVTIDVKEIWGLCIHGTPYQHIQFESRENFIRVKLLGRVSFLSYTREFDDNFNMVPNLMNEDRQMQSEVIDLIVDFDEQRMIRNRRANLEDILQRDPEMYQSYLLEKKKSRAIGEYIEQYNRKYPLDF
ncbi:hypothetical protein KFE98_11215 [bacterium SCSIO 12741]|nr:hypothetical protein KFE98_11215 [bacterium SCSIO 12741]